jgi:hypothetical protein
MLVTFEERRKTDPQGVIDDLLKQITKQAYDIHQKNIALGLDVKDGLEEVAKEIKPKRNLLKKKESPDGQLF